MKPNASGITVQSNIQGTKIAMALDVSATPHLMTMFTELYEDPKAACFREICTNARDAMIAAGKGHLPIKVTKPTPFNPILLIKDEGVGLNQEGIEKVVSLYGASTKRENDDETGALGLGVKSPLAYATQFSIEGIKDGVRTFVSIGRDEDGAGSMTIVETTKTDDPNGVTVMIPAKSNDTFTKEAADFFRFWEKGTALVDGEEPVRAEGLTISDTMFLMKKESYSDTGYVVMGGMPYPLPPDHNPLRNTNYCLVAFVGMGEVSFTPSREALMLNPRTIKRLTELKDEYSHSAKSAVEKDLAKCKKPFEAFNKAHEWCKALQLREESAQFHFKGKLIPEHLIVPGAEKGNWGQYNSGKVAVISDKDSWRPGSSEKRGTIGPHQAENALWVHGFGIGFTAGHKHKLKKYIEDKGYSDVTTFILTDDKMPLEWINPKRTIDWATVKAIKLPVVRSGYTQEKAIAGSYEVYDSGSGILERELEAEKIDTTRPILYYTKPMFFEDDSWDFDTVWGHVKKQEVSVSVVKLGINRVDKFRRDFPAAESVLKWLEDEFNKKVKSVKKEVVEAYWLQQDHIGRTFKNLDSSKFLDPSLKKAVRLAKASFAVDLEPIRAIERSYMTRFFSKQEKLQGDQFKVDIKDKYPLIDYEAIRDHPDHVYVYANAMHKGCS